MEEEKTENVPVASGGFLPFWRKWGYNGSVTALLIISLARQGWQAYEKRIGKIEKRIEIIEEKLDKSGK
jgi:hypothetical protein